MEKSKKRSWIGFTILAVELITILALIAAISLIIIFPTVGIYVIEEISILFSEYYQLFFEIHLFNEISLLFADAKLFNDFYPVITVLLIVIGLYIIRKHIKIAKNRDTLFGLQNIISGYFADSYKEQSQCYKEIESLLKQCLLIRDKNELNLIVRINDTNNLGKIVENTVKRHAFKPINNTLMNNTFYELWLGKDYKKFAHILEGENFNRVYRFYEIYDDTIEQLSKIEVLYSTDHSYKQIHDVVFDKIKDKLNHYNASYEALANEFNLFFKKLTKHKKVS